MRTHLAPVVVVVAVVVGFLPGCGGSDRRPCRICDGGIEEADAAGPPVVDAGRVADGGGTCTPSCSGRECGADGCGGSCGTCGATEGCTTAGVCQGPTCVTTCFSGTVTGPHGTATATYSPVTGFPDVVCEEAASDLDLHLYARRICELEGSSDYFDLRVEDFATIVTGPGRYVLPNRSPSAPCGLSFWGGAGDPTFVAYGRFNTGYYNYNAADSCVLNVTTFDWRPGGRAAGTVEAVLSDRADSSAVRLSFNASFDVPLR